MSEEAAIKYLMDMPTASEIQRRHLTMAIYSLMTMPAAPGANKLDELGKLIKKYDSFRDAPWDELQRIRYEFVMCSLPEPLICKVADIAKLDLKESPELRRFSD